MLRQLSAILGQKMAEALISNAIQELGLRSDRLTIEEARKVMNKIGEMSGIVGAAARNPGSGGSGSSGAPAEVSAGLARPYRSNGPRDPQGSSD